MHVCTVIALEKFKIRVCQGVSGGTKTLFEPFLPVFWSDGLVIASGGPLYSGPSLSYPIFPENRAIDFLEGQK